MRGASRFEGWAITGWLALALAAMAAGVLGIHGWSEEGVRSVVRATARSSVGLFLLAFAASGLRRVWASGATGWLLRNRRYVGVSFAVSHLIHLAALVALGGSFPDPFLPGLDAVTILGGGLAYLFIAAMAATSFDRSAAWLGPRRWKLLHTVGGYTIWSIFTLSYVPRALTDPFYLPLALALLSVLALRITVGLAARSAPPHELPPSGNGARCRPRPVKVVGVRPDPARGGPASQRGCG